MNGIAEVLRQHLIDPEICIRCNTCEETCPVGAITHDARNYVVRADTCNACLACVAPCPTGAIDNWRTLRRAEAYSIEQQFTWDILPAPSELISRAGSSGTAAPAVGASAAATSAVATPAGRAPAAGGSAITTPAAATSVIGTSAIATPAATTPAIAPSTIATPAVETPVDETLAANLDPARRISAPAAPLPSGRAAAGESSLAGSAVASALVPPKSAARPQVNLYTARNPLRATVTGNFRVTDPACDRDTHHIVLDFGAAALPILEGQSIGLIVPGQDAAGRPHPARQYSVASPRDGERAGYNNVAITVKRVTIDHAGQAVRGLCSNYLCDLGKGDTVQVIGPFGTTFLMPNDRDSHLLMICTGTGAAPMRAMTEHRRRLRRAGSAAGATHQTSAQPATRPATEPATQPANEPATQRATDGRLLLFFGARTQQELPYFGPLMNLPRDFIDVNLALSRAPDAPRRYVQDALCERADDVAALLRDDRTHIYVCGVRGMEQGVLEALRAAASGHALAWEPLHERLVREGRLHLETY